MTKNRPYRSGFSAPTFAAGVSLVIFACAGAPRVVDVQNLHMLAPAGIPIGAAVPAGRAANSVLKSEARQAIVDRHFSQITAENIMKPSYLHPAAGTFFFGHADALVDYAASRGKTVHGHTLIWHRGLANWMNDFEGDAAAWTTMMADHIIEVVSHFAEQDVVVSWDVVNEAVSDIDSDGDGVNELRRTIWLENIGPDYLAAAFFAAHEADPNAVLYYNDYNISGAPSKLRAVLELVSRLRDGPYPVPIHGIGFQMHITLTWPDVDQIRESFALAAATGLKVKITELDVPVNTDRSRSAMSMTRFTGSVAARQRKRFLSIVAAYLDEVPEAQRGGISVWGIADPDSWLRRYNTLEWPLLFDDELQPKPALQGLADGLTDGTWHRDSSVSGSYSTKAIN